jgi:hypothetical protein
VAGGVVLLLAVLIGTAGNGATPSRPTASDGVTTAPLPPHREIDAREWQVIAKDPDAHKGERIIVYGYVTQFDAATGNDTFRANVDGVEHSGDEFAYLDYEINTVLRGDAAALQDIVSGDLFSAQVTVGGSLSYDTQIGGSTTVPMLMVDTIRVTGSPHTG